MPNAVPPPWVVLSAIACRHPRPSISTKITGGGASNHRMPSAFSDRSDGEQSFALGTVRSVHHHQLTFALGLLSVVIRTPVDKPVPHGGFLGQPPLGPVRRPPVNGRASNVPPPRPRSRAELRVGTRILHASTNGFRCEGGLTGFLVGLLPTHFDTVSTNPKHLVNLGA